METLLVLCICVVSKILWAYYFICLIYCVDQNKCFNKFHITKYLAEDTSMIKKSSATL